MVSWAWLSVAAKGPKLSFYSRSCPYRYGRLHALERRNGNMHIFSVKLAWEVLRPRDVEKILRAAKRSFDCIVGKLLFAAAAYHIWIERNNRLFKNVRRSPEEIKDIIVVMVWLKIATLRFKNKPRVIQRLSEWKMPNTFRLYG
ncbi:hypothetical protein Tco_1158011 [Tanacetum coccineum]